VTRVGLLFPGEMGALVGAAVQGEVLWASEGRSEATQRRAEAFRDVGTVRELVAASEIVISLCPPAIAEDVAGEVAGEGFAGIYVEANAIAPGRATRIAGFLRCVDGSVIARSGVNLYLSGDPADVAEVAALFGDGEVTAIPLEGGVGAASALKMAFGGWNKIGVALAAQASSATGFCARLRRPGAGRPRWRRSPPPARRWGSPTASRAVPPSSTLAGTGIATDPRSSTGCSTTSRRRDARSCERRGRRGRQGLP